jgi:anti-anti-sigma factor
MNGQATSRDGNGRPGSVAMDQEDDGCALRLIGEIDTNVVKRFRAAPSDDAASIVAVEVGEVTYLSSGGVALLAEVAEAAAQVGRTVALRRAEVVGTTRPRGIPTSAAEEDGHAA